MSASGITTGVVFVHGILGNTQFFDFLVRLVPQGWPVELLTLEGHGGDAADFSRASMRRWKEQVAETVAGMRRRCSRVVIAAHSMGCLFAIAEAVGGNADALFLLNPPLRIRLTGRLLLTPVKVVTGRTGDRLTAAAMAAYGVAVDRNPLHYYGWPARYLELFAEIRRVRPLARQLRCPAMVWVSEHDEMVAPRSARCFEGVPGCRITLLRQSAHFYYSDADRRLIANGFARFLRRIGGESLTAESE